MLGRHMHDIITKSHQGFSIGGALKDIRDSDPSGV